MIVPGLVVVPGLGGGAVVTPLPGSVVEVSVVEPGGTIGVTSEGAMRKPRHSTVGLNRKRIWRGIAIELQGIRKRFLIRSRPTRRPERPIDDYVGARRPPSRAAPAGHLIEIGRKCREC